MDFEIKISEKLSLKLRKIEDSNLVFNVVDANREYLKKWLPWVNATLSSKDTEKYILLCIDKFKNKETVDFGIWYDKQWVGSMGFNKIDTINDNAEIGYWLSSDFQGKGIMTDCVKAMLNYGFVDLNLNRIQIRCSCLNIRSKAIPERLGFKLEGVLRQDHKINGEYSDGLIFGILKSEWCDEKR